ncbi:MAG: hypothetical protein ACOZJX_05780 [Pseudomonadota bacterium]
MNRSVTFVQQGREGQVVYTEGARAITGHMEFGGGDVVTILSMGTADVWQARHAWAVARRAEILRFIADEAIRQRAPGCSAEVDAPRGDVLVRSKAGTSTAPAGRGGGTGTGTGSAAWVFRFSELCSKLALVVLALVLIAGAAGWAWTRVMQVQPGKGVPIGRTVRTDTHLATLIQQLQPYAASLHHDPSTERFTLSVFLVPLDGGAPDLVRIAEGQRAGSYSLAKVIGSDGRTLWLSAAGLHGVDLRSHTLVTAADVRTANPQLPPIWTEDVSGIDIVDGRLRMLARDRSAAYALEPTTLRAEPVPPRPVVWQPGEPPLTLNMAAGVQPTPQRWLGLHSRADLEGAFKPKRWVRAVESARDAQEMRRLVRGELEGHEGTTGSRQIVSMAPVGEAEYLNAFFLRPNEKSPPLRPQNPDSVLMAHTSVPGAKGTLVVTRVDVASGTLLWSRDTGIDRFKLQQILPGERSTVFVGPRVPVPGQIGEPLLVIVDHASGQAVTHSLWR